MKLILIITSKLPSFLLVVLCSSFITAVVRGESFKCKKVDCGCRFTRGNITFEISMKGISQRDSPTYTGVEDASNPWTYDIDPCYGFSENTCTDVTMCQKSKSKPTQYIPIALPNTQSYGNYEEGQPLQVTYKDNSKRRMIINLKYGKEASFSDVKQSTSSDVTIFTLTITHPSLKPEPASSGGPSPSSSGGLSTGSVIIIIFFVVLVIYLVAGVLFMKYRRGATGKEVIPNVEFWSSLPGLIKDGCVFFGKNMKDLCGRCCQREGYSEI